MTAVLNYLSKPKWLSVVIVTGFLITGYIGTDYFLTHGFNRGARFVGFTLPSSKYSGPNLSDWAVIEAYCGNLKRDGAQRIAMLNAIGNWSSAAPMDFANNVSPGLFYWNYQGLFGTPASTLSKAGSIENPGIRYRIIKDAFRALTKQDPLKALDFARLLPYSAYISEMRTLANELGKSSTSDTMIAILKHQNCTADFASNVIASWAKNDTEQALKFIDEADSLQFPSGRLSKPSVWSELDDSGDGEIRLRYLEKMPKSFDREGYVMSAKGSILAAHPEKWDSLMQADKNQLAIGKIANDAAMKAAKTSQENAMFFLNKIPSIEEKTKAITYTTGELLFATKGNPAVIEEWLGRAPDSLTKETILKALKYYNVAVPKGYKP